MNKVEAPKIEGDQAPDHGPLSVGNDTLTDAVREHGFAEIERGAHEDHRDDGYRYQQHHIGALLEKDELDRGIEQPSKRGGRRRASRHAKDRKKEAQLLRPEIVAQEPPHQREIAVAGRGIARGESFIHVRLLPRKGPGGELCRLVITFFAAIARGAI